MANANVRVTIKGLDELVKKLDNDLAAVPARRFLTRSGAAAQGTSRKLAPKDRSQLANSIIYEVDEAAFPRYVRIGTNVKHGPPMEGGTGLLADLPGGKGGSHYPPAAPLETWAVRHGFQPKEFMGKIISPGQQVANIIGRRGGLKPRRFLRDGFEDARPKIESYVPVFAQEIEETAGRG